MAERKIFENGKDTGVREDNQGNIYIDTDIYLRKKEVVDQLKKLSKIFSKK